MPGARGIAVEPIPATFDWLKSNLAANSAARYVQTLCAAVSGVSGSVTLGYSRRDSSKSSVFRSDESCEVVAPTVTLSALASQLGERIDLIKIDIEGAEYDLLQDLGSVLSDHEVHQLIIEYHPVKNIDPRQFIESITKFRMELNLKHFF